MRQGANEIRTASNRLGDVAIAVKISSMFDPNWFYSSLAQCAAAVVGVLGAVLATRLQSQFAEVRTQAEGLRARLQHLRRQLNDLANAALAYGRFADERITAMGSVLSSGGSQMKVQTELSFWGGSRGGEGWPTAVTREAVAGYEHNRVFVDPVVQILRGDIERRSARLEIVESLRAMIPRMPEELSAGAVGVVQDITAVSTALDQHGRFVAESIRVPAVLTLTVAWLCLFGLVVPLWFLSAYSLRSKAMLLLGFSIGIIALPVYVLREIISVYRLRDIR